MTKPMQYFPRPVPEILGIVDMSADVANVAEVPVVGAGELPAIPAAVRRTLNGYDTAMRRHAATCEAGR